MGQRVALLTDAIEIRPQGLLGEVLFPQAGREEVPNFKGGLRIHALQHIHQIAIGIDASRRHDASKL